MLVSEPVEKIFTLKVKKKRKNGKVFKTMERKKRMMAKRAVQAMQMKTMILMTIKIY
jgi:hypothetical protein